MLRSVLQKVLFGVSEKTFGESETDMNIIWTVLANEVGQAITKRNVYIKLYDNVSQTVSSSVQIHS